MTTLNYQFNHLDFLHYEYRGGLLARFRPKYFAQDKNGTWSAFVNKPVKDLQYECWVNPAVSKPVTPIILYDPFDGYPQNLEWTKSIIKITPEFMKELYLLHDNYDYFKKPGEYVGRYILFGDGTFGIIEKSSANSRTYLRLLTNTYMLRSGEQITKVQYWWEYPMLNIIKPSEVIGHNYLYIPNKFRIIKVIT